MKVYKFFRFSLTEAWWQLTPEEQAARLAQIEETRKKVGGKLIVSATPYWSEEQWMMCGVEELPSAEAVMQYAQLLYDQSHSRYFQGESWLATDYPPRE